MEKQVVKRIAGSFMICVAMLLAGCAGGDENKARDVVTSFYKMHQQVRPIGALTLNELITFRHFMSVTLFDLLKDTSVAEEARTAQATQAAEDPLPPLVEGDIFTGNPAGASTFRIVQCEIGERDGKCAVELIYSDAKLKAPAKWTDQVLLTRDARGWVIDNIEYAKGAAPMRSGNLQAVLTKLLKRDTLPLQ
ncbi:hypothetical protein [Herbaspirillum sp. alder98]|uniref:hypothetical protein n=1 Tax=Herbaspirillum sp. alder98 TaxID=2913096 RepID=UPI001CD865EB|nr:hypothetical protein [Herbaspirillum sp. alder98]MCA1324858.1 hypothetical protein [Herbaspirillum sp. alder98]